MIDSVLRTIREHQMLERGDGVVVAVSGGADSMALLSVLTALREEWRLALHVAHLDHGLRPDAAEDAAFVEAAARRFGLPVTVERADVRALAAREKRSVEDAGRQARYAFFSALASRIGARRIATAHTRDDQIETVLMRLMQGGPWEMLAGIAPLRRLGAADVVRPLRDLSRAQVAAFLREREIAWREDPTNLDLRYVRNRLRHETLPPLARARPGVEAALWDLGESARTVAASLDRLALRLYGQVHSGAREVVHFDAATFRRFPEALQRRLLRLAVAGVTGTELALPFVIERRACRAAASGAVGSEVPLGEAVVRVGYGTIEVASASGTLPAEEYSLPVPGEVRAEVFDLLLTAEIVDAADAGTPAPSVALFDAGCVAAPLVIRARRPGDRFVPAGLGGKKKLQDFFVDAKVPRWERSRIALVVDAQDRILWLVGYRAAETCRVTERTKQVLRVRARSA